MAYKGRPSRGCSTCRKRKIKCDLSEPACSKCSQAGWSCPGYKSETDLNFRNQTALVIRKSQADRPAFSQHEIDNSSNRPLSLGLWNRSDRPQIRTKQVSTPIVDQATAFFFYQYVFGADDQSRGPIRGNHEYIPALHREGSSSGALATITAAAGLAGLSNAGNSPAWSSQAYRLYGKALRQIQVALSDPAKLKSDQTLAAVMLMGTFEAITCANKDSMRSLGYHTIAPARLIDIRGPEQFRNSPMAIRLFLQIRRLIVLTSHQMQEPMPYTLKKWSQWAEPTQREDEYPANRFSEINEQLAAARAYIKHQAITTPSVIASFLNPIDEMLQNWRNDLPPSWSPKSYRLLRQGPSEYFELDSQHDMYPDLWIASMWNNYRSARILIHVTLISAMMKNNSPEERVNLQSSIQILREMTVETCHSVPYHLGYCRKSDEDHTYPDLNSQEYQATPGGYLLIWPLYMAGMLPTTTKDQRRWIADRLCRIGINMGVRLANSLGTILYQEDQKSFTNTDLWAIDGSCSNPRSNKELETDEGDNS